VNNYLRDLPNFVPDAFKLVPAVPFTPENIVFGFYTFLPWVRTGIAAAVTAPPPGDIRARTTISVPVQGGATPQDVTQTLVVRGPGDLVGFQGNQIIRRYPEWNATRAEDSFLVHVEFDRPDFPWIFSPAAPSGERLSPWLVLVTLRDDAAEITAGTGGLPDQVNTTLSELQPLDDSWAWAHAQLVGKAADPAQPSVDDRLTSDYASVNLSRILCPRRLNPDERYRACLVPAYDAGVKAGLGLAQGTLDPAWKRAPDGSDGGQQITLPVYSSWTFETTSTAGDFKSLAERLVAVRAPWQVGRRLVDVAAPGGELPPLGADDPGRLQTTRGPLYSPQSPSPTSQDPTEVAAANAETAAWPGTEIEALRTLLNQPHRLAGAENDRAADIPLVGPVIYAGAQAALNEVDSARDADWFGELNLTPRNRITAGLGTRVVEKDQEQIMQAAWAQVGDIDAANRQLRLSQLARFCGASLLGKHLANLDYSPLLQITRPLHGRIRPNGGATVYSMIENSATPSSAAGGAFRRGTRPLGPLARYASRTAAGPLDALLGGDGTPRDFQRPYVELDGVAGVSDAGARALDPTLAARVLNLEAPTQDALLQALDAHGRSLAQTPAVPDVLTPTAVQNANPDPNFNLPQRAGQRLLDVMQTHFQVDEQRKAPAPALNAISLLSSLQKIGGVVGTHALSLSQQIRTTSVIAPQLQVAPQPRLNQIVRLAPIVAASSDMTVQGLAPVAMELVSPTWPKTPDRPPLSLGRSSVLRDLDPGLTLTNRVLARIGSLPSWLPPGWFDDHLVQPIMAAPVFTRPMYQALDAYDRQWLIPGLAKMSEPDMVTVLLSNAEFIEAFLVGLSHELGRKLLWRGYPTDMRGTYFRRFWNGSADELQQEIHLFTPTPLATHLAPTLSRRLVLFVRGELILHYPNALVLAMRAGGTDSTGHPIFIDPSSDPTATAPILFHDHLSPDIVLAGFDLTVDQVRTQSWWFVIAEHPSAPRFGLADGRVVPLTRDTMAWGDLPTVQGTQAHPLFLSAATTVSIPDSALPGGSAEWGADAANTAHMMLRDPVRAAFDARTLLGPTGALA
jgi:hypothetical protein